MLITNSYKKIIKVIKEKIKITLTHSILQDSSICEIGHKICKLPIIKTIVNVIYIAVSSVIASMFDVIFTYINKWTKSIDKNIKILKICFMLKLLLTL